MYVYVYICVCIYSRVLVIEQIETSRGWGRRRGCEMYNTCAACAVCATVRCVMYPVYRNQCRLCDCVL